MKQINCLGLIFILFAVACSEEYINKNPLPLIKNSSTYKYSIVDTVIFELDDTSTPFLKSVEAFNFNDKTIYSFLNNYTNQIYLYDYDTRNLHGKITISDSVVDALANITGYTIHNMDSIFIYGYKNKSIALMDSSGTLKSVYNWPDMLINPVKYPANPRGWTFSPIIYNNDKIVMSGYTTGEMKLNSPDERPVVVVLDIENNTAHYAANYPEEYDKGNWGGLFYRKVYNAWNPSKQLWVYSFPASHFVYATHHKKNEIFTKHYAGSKQLESISSLDAPKGIPFPKSWREEHYALNNSYGEIIYNPWKKEYYRFAEKKLDKFDGNLYKQKVLVILNEDLQYVSEVDLSGLTSNMIYTYGIFVTKEGLNLQLLDGNEDQILILVLNFEIE